MRAQPFLADHLILTSYGFWLGNDPRGSGSDRLRQGKFAELGPIIRNQRIHPPVAR